MNPIATLLRCRPAALPPRKRPRRPPPRDDGPEADPDADAPAGCGWYDSSCDLRSGLVVHEHASVEPLSADLPLADWIELRLQGWHGLPSA